MEEHNILCIANRSEFRAWLEAHHASERECWVDVKRVRPVDDKHFWYLDAVEEALCFAYNVAFYKTRDKSMYEQTLSHLITETKAGRMFGEWNDYGRLLDY